MIVAFTWRLAAEMLRVMSSAVTPPPIAFASLALKLDCAAALNDTTSEAMLNPRETTGLNVSPGLPGGGGSEGGGDGGGGDGAANTTDDTTGGVMPDTGTPRADDIAVMLLARFWKGPDAAAFAAAVLGKMTEAFTWRLAAAMLRVMSSAVTPLPRVFARFDRKVACAASSNDAMSDSIVKPIEATGLNVAPGVPGGGGNEGGALGGGGGNEGGAGGGGVHIGLELGTAPLKNSILSPARNSPTVVAGSTRPWYRDCEPAPGSQV